jgi:hypothetical protein
MTAQFTFEAVELDKLDVLGDNSVSQANALRGVLKKSDVDFCAEIRRILPIIKMVRDIVCSLKFIPGLKQACQALELIIPILEKLCPPTEE